MNRLVGLLFSKGVAARTVIHRGSHTEFWTIRASIGRTNRKNGTAAENGFPDRLKISVSSFTESMVGITGFIDSQWNSISQPD